MISKLTLRFVRITITIILIAFVFYKANLLTTHGWQNLFAMFVRASPALVAMQFGIGFLIILVSAFKWYMLLLARGLSVNIWRLSAYYTIGKFFNTVLPTSVGGDVVRMNELGRYTGKYPEAAASVFVERFIGMVVLVVLATLSIVINLHLFNQPWLTVGLSLVIGAMVVFIFWLIIASYPYRWIQQIEQRMPYLGQISPKIGQFRQAVIAYKKNSSAIWIALINSLLFYILAILNVWISALCFGANIGFVDMLMAVPISLFIINLPISIGDIGLMEFSYSFILGLFGVSPVLAISTALLMRIQSFLYAGVGGILYLCINNAESYDKQSFSSIVNGHAVSPHE